MRSRPEAVLAPVPASRRPLAALALLAVLALTLGGCTSPSQQSPEVPSPSATTGSQVSPTVTGSPSPSPSPSPAATPAPTSLEIAPPRPRATSLVQGVYPRVRSRCVNHSRATLTGRYPGTLTIERADDGTLSLTARITFEDYLEGIAEVPPSWPAAALQAQAIAARSYALASTGWTGEGETLDEPICSTTSCQVYRGIPIAPSPDIERWYRAVRATRGQILLYEGRPATTFYFSTSNGQTYGNEEVFGGDPLPYLRPVTETDDGASSTAHWSVDVGFADLARFLHAAGEWPGSKAITQVGLDGGTVTVSGPGGSRSMDLGTFRDAVNAWGPCLAPDRYPAGGLPTTIPSRWLTLSSGPDGITVTGRGWGHGVGMVQWGAYGKARRGLSASDILSFYYGGFRPEPFPEPGLIDVQIASGLSTFRIRPSAPGTTVNGEPLEGRRIVVTGGDELVVGTT